MSIAVLGEALVDFILCEDGAYRPHFGGSPYNLAIGLARQGMEVSYLSPLSDDVFGDKIERILDHEGIVYPISNRSTNPTSLALVAIDSHGDAAYSFYREGIADKDFSLEQIEQCLPENLEIFHTGSLAITPSQIIKILSLINVMHQRDVRVSLDLNIRVGASKNLKNYLDGVLSLIPLADIVKASDEDLLAFDIDNDPRIAAQYLFDKMKSGLFILTLGDSGAVVYSKTTTVELPAYTVQDFKDTVGAGDSFYAAFLAQLSRAARLANGLGFLDAGSLEEALNMASASAAINVSRVGCQPPTYAQVLKFIEDQNG